MTHTKKSISQIVAESNGLVTEEVLHVFQQIINCIDKALVNGDRVEVRDFGIWSTKVSAARKARNPKTGEAVDVSARRKVHFKPGKGLSDRVRDKYLDSETEEKGEGDK